MGTVDSTWLVRSASTAGMHVDDLSQIPGTAAADHAIQNVGTVNAKEITVSATTSGYDATGADYPAPAICGTNDSAPDAIYQLSASAPTQVHIAVRNPNFNGSMTLYESPDAAPTAAPWTQGVLGLSAAETPLTTTNETIAAARNVTFPTTPGGGGYTGYAAGFNGTPAVSNVASAAFQVAEAQATAARTAWARTRSSSLPCPARPRARSRSARPAPAAITCSRCSIATRVRRPSRP